MKLNEYLEIYPEEIDYDIYHKLDEMYSDEELDEHIWAKLLISYEEEDRRTNMRSYK